ncbi:uncharacterized protein LOC131683623 [Topomyia yanbarensis]|uniref:uncharacterized protein LOC131683623 n=1 Tax=Topomyia yanbarensis TaxID=2498891 RepID=UPI00273BF543|nr:uncharacterized protein LOC131683623 [Topomyia yanbarensis]
MDINPAEYYVVHMDDGTLVEMNGYVHLCNKESHQMVEVRYEDAARFYGLPPLVEESPVAEKSAKSWTDGQTKLMLSLYRDKMEEVGPLKKFKSKKQLWTSIKQGMEEKIGPMFNERQIENRYKTLTRRHRATVTHNKVSGNTLEKAAYFGELSDIAALDDSLEPEILMDTNSIRQKTTNDTMSETITIATTAGGSTPSTSHGNGSAGSSGRKRSQRNNVQWQLLEAYKEAQEAKKQRHIERMVKIDKLTDILGAMAQRNDSSF